MVLIREYGYITLGKKQLYHVIVGKGKPCIVILGWASNLDKFLYEEAFGKDKKILREVQFIFIHLSNFSNSSISSEPFDLEKYDTEILEIFNYFRFKRVDLIGHSAGGRICLFFAIHHPELVNKLILMSSAGLKHKPAPKRMMERASEYFSRFDDLNISEFEILKKTLVNVYNTELNSKLFKVKSKTLIVWGEKDNVISRTKAFVFNKGIRGSKLVIFPNIGHSTLDVPEVAAEVFNFLRDK